MTEGLESEDYRALDKAKQEKRASNREQSALILQRGGCVFESKNDGAHLIVLAGSHEVDFWPGTGLWIVRGEQQKRRGVRKLVTFVERSRQAPSNVEITGDGQLYRPASSDCKERR